MRPVAILRDAAARLLRMGTVTEQRWFHHGIRHFVAGPKIDGYRYRQTR
jgi:hypothetical protein